MKKCRICECTDVDACVMPCYWVNDDLCSTCAEFLEMMAAYAIIAGPHHRRTVPDMITVLRRCILEIAGARDLMPEDELPPEPLIVVAGR